MSTKIKKRVLYLLSRENALEPGVLKSQVFELINEIQKRDPATSVLVLDFPSINRFFKYIRNYHYVRSYLKDFGINLVIIPILPIGRSVMPFWAIPFFLIQVLPLVLFFVVKNKINVIHARAYLSALVCYSLKKLGLPISYVFDMRGPYLQEGITYNLWKESDLSYRMWRNIERSLFKSADSVVAQSYTLMDYVKSIYKGANVETIPCCVVPAEMLIGKDRDRARKKLGLYKKFVVVYSGSFGSFHEPWFIANFYNLIRPYIKNSHFLVATHSDIEEFAKAMRGFDIPENEFTVLQSPKNLKEIISLGDIGIHVMNDLPITPFSFSVKFSDYLASGLPVVITSNMSSLVEVVKQYQCGIGVDPGDSRTIKSGIRDLVANYAQYKRGASKITDRYLSTGVCANRYLEIYDELIQKNKF